MKHVKKSLLLPLILVPCVAATTMALLEKPIGKQTVATTPYKFTFDFNNGDLLNSTTESRYEFNTQFYTFTYNKPGTSDSSITYPYVFEFSGATSDSEHDNFGEFEKESTFSNVSSIAGIQSIKIEGACFMEYPVEDFDPSNPQYELLQTSIRANIYWWWDNGIDSGSAGISDKMDSLYFDFLDDHPNYFEIQFFGSTTVSKIEIVYECTEEGEVPDLYINSQFRYEIALLYNSELDRYMKRAYVLGLSERTNTLVDITEFPSTYRDEFTIDTICFYGEQYLRSLVIPSTYTGSSFGFLVDCPNAVSISMLVPGLYLTDNTCTDCPNLTTLYLDKTITMNPSAFVNCPNVTTIYTNVTTASEITGDWVEILTTQHPFTGTVNVYTLDGVKLFSF